MLRTERINVTVCRNGRQVAGMCSPAGNLRGHYAKCQARPLGFRREPVRLSPTPRSRQSSVPGERSWQVLDSLVACLRKSGFPRPGTVLGTA